MKGRRALAALVVVSLFVAGTAAVAGGPVAAQTAGDSTASQQQDGTLLRGSPDLDVSVAQPTINAGETNDVTLQITNDGDLDLGSSEARETVTTARNVRVEADAEDTPLTVETGTSAIGSVTESQPGEAPIAVSVPDDVDSGTYDIDVEVDYSYTYQESSGVVYDRSRTMDSEVEVEVSDDARFEITNVTTDAQVGDTGTLEADVENVGADTARDATVALESTSAGFAFGESAEDSARLGRLEPGETTTVTYDAGFDAGAPVRDYALDGTVTFDTSEGYQRADDSLSASVTPLAEQEFSLTDVESTLRVGEDGDLTGTVHNDGPSTARSVVVQYAGDDQSINPVERSTAVGTLEANQSTDFSLPISIGGEAEAGLRSLDMAVEYRTAEGESRADERLAVDADVASERDQFDIAVQNRTIQTGETRTVEVDVTNNLNETADDVEARLFADDPLDSGDTDTGYIPSLDPGETTTMSFEVAATDAAAPGNTYPVSFDFRYDDADGDSQLTDTTRVPIDVTEREDGGLPLPVIVVAFLLVGTVALVIYRRRQ
ncbi:CARDB domain-containing protein [Halorubrum sp. AD140]|uniref:COG1361 S-layer family protein n=1 Tax=Halorubrum sp. AD140 TaxID=3050073 RepID=UPI002ACD0B7C|nr:CARDB domain-containing protein [Halorubrum sp. AD140]MDZ5811827.1 CARDB domain-containing protein [Halorubrum sp. AD140]